MLKKDLKLLGPILTEYLLLLIYLYLGAKILIKNNTDESRYLLASLVLYIPIIISVLLLSKKNNISFSDLGINKNNLSLVGILFLIYILLYLYKKYNGQNNFIMWIFFLFSTGVSEELIFRGYFYEMLKNIFPRKKSILINSFLFSFMHLPPQIIIRGLNLYGMLTYMSKYIIGFILVSIFYCILKDRYKTIYIPILLHSIFNYI